MSNNKNSEKEKGISRIDSGSTHGWFVRGYRNNKTYSKLFSDRKHGGKEKALEEAVAHRNKLMSELSEIPKKPRGRRVVFRDKRNTTGVLGVSRTKKKSANGTVVECYSVSWRPEPGVQKCTSFSIRKYGEEEAFKLAVELRRKKMSEVYGEQEALRMEAKQRETMQ